MEITLSDSKSAIIPAEIAHDKCKVLIDTGASRSFMREDYFKKLPNAKLMPTLRDVRIRSATGRDVQTLGRTITQFKLGITWLLSSSAFYTVSGTGSASAVVLDSASASPRSLAASG